MISESEFLDWKSQLATKEVMAAIDRQVAGCTSWLASQAGLDPINDRFMAGQIRALQFLSQATYAEVFDGV